MNITQEISDRGKGKKSCNKRLRSQSPILIQLASRLFICFCFLFFHSSLVLSFLYCTTKPRHILKDKQPNSSRTAFFFLLLLSPPPSLSFSPHAYRQSRRYLCIISNVNDWVRVLHFRTAAASSDESNVRVTPSSRSSSNRRNSKAEQAHTQAISSAYAFPCAFAAATTTTATAVKAAEALFTCLTSTATRSRCPRHSQRSFVIRPKGGEA